MSRLGELLVRDQLISSEQLHKAQEEARRSGERLGNSLVKLGAIQEEDLTQFLSKQYGVPAINLAEFDVEPDVVKLITKEVAKKHRVIPVNRAGNSLIVAMADPANVLVIDDVRAITDRRVSVRVAAKSHILEALRRYVRSTRKTDMVLDVEGVDWGTVVAVRDAAHNAGVERAHFLVKPAP
jgi:type IV pilus assembly protein PilB